ncbi:hypothetical protein RBU60_04795 [Mesonia sp. MT50]|uniref:Lipoprotein n=1 Tax=Mesonia profundi TaxID=3070998 RepID=A0ABU0ZZK1_9FLAO|nr:hypothetical protein [Mesonia profundi]MDQ7916883.1 hypothetical protein [Mesonia profundi]
MKKILLTLVFGILIFSCSSTKTANDKTKYFDENNVEISQLKFNQIQSKREYLAIAGDSSHHRKLVVREKRGKITNRVFLESLLEEQTNQEIDANQPIIIIYYPGKDRCNSSSSATKQSRKSWYGQLEDGIHQTAPTQPIYIYKDKNGLEIYHDVLTWHKDPEGAVETLFFPDHYACSSFVVISKNGDYISHFGEFGKESVWKATAQLINK